MAVRPAPAVQKLTIIEDGLLLSMAFNNKFTKEFPFLKGLQQYKGQTGKIGCGSCGRGRDEADARRSRRGG